MHIGVCERWTASASSHNFGVLRRGLRCGCVSGGSPPTCQTTRNRAGCLQVTTFGKKGAVLLRRVDAEPSAGDPQTLQPVLDSMFEELAALPQPVQGADTAAVTTESGVPVFPGHVVRTGQPVTLQFDRCIPPHAPPC